MSAMNSVYMYIHVHCKSYSVAIPACMTLYIIMIDYHAIYGLTDRSEVCKASITSDQTSQYIQNCSLGLGLYCTS